MIIYPIFLLKCFDICLLSDEFESVSEFSSGVPKNLASFRTFERASPSFERRSGNFSGVPNFRAAFSNFRAAFRTFERPSPTFERRSELSSRLLHLSSVVPKILAAFRTFERRSGNFSSVPENLAGISKFYCFVQCIPDNTE